MEEQMYVVMLKAYPAYSCHFPGIGAERMTNIIRDGFYSNFIVPVPFKITVIKAESAAVATGDTREHEPEESDVAPEECLASTARWYRSKIDEEWE